MAIDADRRALKNQPKWIGYGVTVLLEAALTGLLLTISPYFPLGKYPITYVLITMIAAYFFGAGPACLAGILGWLMFTHLFVREQGAWLPHSAEAWAREAAFFLGVSLVGIAAIQAKKSNRSIQRLADDTMTLNASLTDEIRARTQADEALRQSEERYRTVFNTMIEGFCVIEVIFDSANKPIDYRFLEVNPAFEKQTGLQGAQGKLMRELAPGREEHWFETYGRIALTGEPAHFVNEAKALGRWYSVSAYRVGGEGSRKVAILFNDITENKRAEGVLREQTRMLDLVHVIVRDMDSRIVFWNKGAEALYGYESEDVIGRTTHEVLQTRFPVPLQEIMSHLMETGEWEGELIHRKADGGELAIASHWVVYRNENSEPAAIIETNNDITRQKHIEDELRKLSQELDQRVNDRTRQLEDANKELEAFSYSVSHDLRAPLRAIDGFSDALLKHYLGSLDERGQDYLKRVRGAAQRMGQLIDDILGLSRAGRAEMRLQRIDLSGMVVDILTDLRRSQPDGEAEIEVAPGMVAEADDHLLRIALNNLLTNAWKFTGNRDVRRIEFGSLEQNGKRVYFVKDNGAGFNPMYADKLFSAFQRLHSEAEFPGTGIGLALVSRILRRHGGRIWAESEVDKGATFYFTLEGD
jgi:PAS domain S-box-containing protein